LVAKLVAGSPQLGERCRLRGVDGPLDGLTVHTVAADLDGVGAAYVCMADEDATALAVAGVLQQQLPGAAVVLAVRRDAGVVGLLNEGRADTSGGLGAVQAFSVLERTCHPELRLLAIDENLARSIHEHHRRLRLEGGADPGEAAVRDWDALPEDLRDSNRQQARHIRTKLRAIDCDLVPSPGWQPTRVTFTEAEVERLAEMEHQRWVEERTLAGWRRGDPADPADPERRTSPYLVAWADLPEQAKAWNREAVREIPDLVALEGFEVVRLTPPPWLEDVARAIHDEYRGRREAPAWQDLAPALQASNRDQAAAIPEKLALVGCRLVPSASANGFDGFTDTEVELLAEREHERWVRERTAGAGPARADDLVPWAQLAEDRRELDREAVRAIPTVVAAAGLGVTRQA
ncbi:MAG TPA: RyR domain-containing protein, partial [Acidimicrobiales bacterium]|nr:RyR domain-containing protein [Acidimicrobiales bacterium]